MRARLRSLPLVFASGVVALTTSACSSSPSAGLVVAIETDVPLPKDVDTIELQVQANGSTQFDNSYPVGMGALLIPATLTLLPGSAAGEPVTIRLLAYQNGDVRMLRQAITTIPTTRVATLQMPIQWLDFGMTTGGSMMDPNGVQSSCTGSGMTSDEGACVPDKVDSSTLPDYSASAVFGGGDGTGDGTCFDLLGCFTGSTQVKAPTSGACTVTSPIPNVMNVALLLSPSAGDGECKGSRCLVPLPMGPSGWTEGASHVIQLPAAACRSSKVAGVLLSTATVASSKSASCESFTTGTPLCGPWSSVAAGTSSGESDESGDAGAPDATTDTGEDLSVTFGKASTLAGGSSSPQPSITGDDASVYWTTAHAVMRIQLADGATQQPVASEAGAAPTNIVVHGTTLYWVNALPDGSVMSTSTDGGTPVTIATGQASPRFIATDDHFVYWTNFAAGPDGGPIADAGTIMRAPIGSAASSVLVSGQSGPSGIAVDDTSVYWTNVGAQTVMRAALDGSAVVTLTDDVMLDPSTNPLGLSGGGVSPGRIGLDDASVYWTGNSTTGSALEWVSKSPPDGTSNFASQLSETNLESVFVAGPIVFFVDSVDGGTINACSNGNCFTLDAGAGAPTSLFVNGQRAYWTSQTGAVYTAAFTTSR